jgi:hypothetical protein
MPVRATHRRNQNLLPGERDCVRPLSQLVVVQFEKSQKDCHSEARDGRARNLLFRCWRQADSSPMKLASE